MELAPNPGKATLMEFIDEILKVKKPSSKLIDNLAEQYSAIAFRFGYYEAQSPCWLYFLRKDGAAAAFELQFGNVSEFKSSLSHTMRLEAVRGLLLKNFQIKSQKFVLIDIETGRALKVNYEWEKFEQK